MVYSMVFRKDKGKKGNKFKLKLMKRERKKEGRKQPEFLVDILSTHPCVLFPSGRNKHCLCVFSRPFRKCYRAIIAQLSNSQSLFRLSLLPLPTWALPLTPQLLLPPCSLLGCSRLSSVWQPDGGGKLLPACHFHYTHAYFHLETFFFPLVNNNNGGGKNLWQ